MDILASTNIALGLACVTTPALAEEFTTQTVNVGSQPQAVVTVDVDRNGLADIVSAVQLDGTVSITLALGQGSFAPAPVLLTGGQPVDVAAADLDGDTFPDLVVLDAGTEELGASLGRGDGTFDPAVKVEIGASPQSVLLGDVTGDGLIDAVVLRDSFSHPIGWLPGLGDGTFGEPIIPTMALNARAGVLADVNDDGLNDLALVDTDANAVFVLLGDPLGGLLPPGEGIPVGTDPVAITAADLNDDEVPEIITANTTSGDISVLGNDGAGNFSASVDFDVGANPTDVDVGDVTGDGTRDFVVSLGGASTLGVFSADGVGGIELVADIPTGLVPVSIAIADLNGDFFLDIVSSDAFGNTLTIAESTVGPWVDVGFEMPGPLGTADLSAAGIPRAGSTVRLDTKGVPAGTFGLLVFGSRRVNTPVGNVVVVPSQTVLLPVTAGELISFEWPSAAPVGDDVYIQAFFPFTPGGLAATNALRTITQNP